MRTQRRTTALLIDDDPNCLELIASMAEIWDVPVLQAEDCKQGLQVLEREHGRIKVILLDYFMPGMEPAKCAESIVSKAGNEIPVVLMTAAVDAGVRAAELRISRWLSKPFDMSALENVLTRS